MIINYKKNGWFFLLIVALLFGCEKSQPEATSYIEPRCISAQNSCVQENTWGRFYLSFDVEQVYSETPFNYYLTYQNDRNKGEYTISSVQGYVVGRNMYMGKIPVFFKSFSLNNTYQGEGLLGSCSEAIMQWDLHIFVTFRNNATQVESTQEIIFTYTSQRS